MKIIVIGSGFGGLYAAIKLQNQGHEVTILEKRDKPGGRAYVYEQDGYKFDGGPTIITAPWLIHDLFTECGRDSETYLKLVPVDPFYNVRFPDGSVFRYDGQRENVIREIEKFNPADVGGYHNFFKATEAIYKAGFDLIDAPFTKLSDMLRVVPDLARLRADRSVVKFVYRFFKDERLRQVFSFHPLLIGGNPFQGTSIYALIHKLEQEFGVWYAMGGTASIVQAFVKLFEELGGQIQYEQEVKQIVINPITRLASGVQLANAAILPAHIIVSNADFGHTYLKLIPAEFRQKWTDKKVKNLQYAMSLFVIYFGTNRRYEDIAHHEIIMGPRYRGLIDDIFKHKRLADDFSLYLHRPTATDPSLAPPGCDSWYVLSPVPHLGGNTDWQKTAKSYRDRIIKFLEDKYMPDLSKHIVTEHYIDPLHFRDTLNSHLGSAFSVEPILTQSAWMRPHNLSEDVPNLYLVGAGTHPGAGLPGVMSSGKIVAAMIGNA